MFQGRLDCTCHIQEAPQLSNYTGRIQHLSRTMFKSIIALAVYSGLVLAQNETLKFFWPYGEDYPVPAVTVKSVNASATVFYVACPSTSSGSDCDWRLGLNYTIFDQTTYEATMTGDEYAVTRTCVDQSEDGVKCYAEGYDGKIKSQYLANEFWASDATNTVTATIASGAEKLKAAPTNAVSGSSSAAAAGSAVTSTGASATGSVAPSPVATGAAGKHCADLAASGLVALCLGAAALYM